MLGENWTPNMSKFAHSVFTPILSWSTLYSFNYKIKSGLFSKSIPALVMNNLLCTASEELGNLRSSDFRCFSPLNFNITPVASHKKEKVHFFHANCMHCLLAACVS